MKYPKECPVFEVTNKFYYTGLIVEGVGWDRMDLFFRFTDGTKSSVLGKDIDGFVPSSGSLKPLTLAAKEMLAEALAAQRSD